jgi:hypothetical protein
VRQGDTTLVHGSFDRGSVEIIAGPSDRRVARMRFGVLDAWVWTRSIERILPGHLLRARVAGAIILGGPVILLCVIVASWWTSRRTTLAAASGVARAP